MIPRELRSLNSSVVQHSIERISNAGDADVQSNVADGGLQQRRLSVANVLSVLAAEVDRLKGNVSLGDANRSDRKPLLDSFPRKRDREDIEHESHVGKGKEISVKGEEGHECSSVDSAEKMLCLQRPPRAYEKLLSALSGENAHRVVNEIQAERRQSNETERGEVLAHVNPSLRAEDEPNAPDNNFLSLDLGSGNVDGMTADGNVSPSITSIEKELENLAMLRIPLHRSRQTVEDAIVENVRSLAKDGISRYGCITTILLRMTVRSKVMAIRAGRNGQHKEEEDWKPRVLESVDENCTPYEAVRGSIGKIEMEGKNMEYLLEGILTNQVEDEISQLALERCFSVVGKLVGSREEEDTRSFPDMIIMDQEMDLLHWLYLEYNSFDSFTALFGAVLCNMIVRLMTRVTSLKSSASHLSVQSLACETSQWMQSQTNHLSLTVTGRLNETRWLYMMSSVVAIRQHLATLPHSGISDVRVSGSADLRLSALHRVFELLQRNLCRLIAPMMAFAGTTKLADAIEGEDAVLPGDLFIHRDVFWDAMVSCSQSNPSFSIGNDEPNARQASLDDTRKFDRDGSNKHAKVGSNASNTSLRTQSLVSLWFAWRKEVRSTGVLPVRSAVEDLLTAQRFATAVVSRHRNITQRCFSLMLRVCQELSKARVTVETTGRETTSLGDSDGVSLHIQHSNALNSLRDRYSATYACGKGISSSNSCNPYVRAQQAYISPPSHSAQPTPENAASAPSEKRDFLGDWMYESFYYTYTSSCFPVLSVERQFHLIDCLTLLANLINRDDGDGSGSEGLSSFSALHVLKAENDALKAACVGCTTQGSAPPSNAESLTDDCAEAFDAQNSLPDISKELRAPLHALLVASQERLRSTVCDIIRSDLRCLMCIFHSVFILLERSATTTIDARSVLWKRVLPALAELFSVESPTGIESNENVYSASRKRLMVQTLKIVSSCGLLQLSWDLHDTALVMTRFSCWCAALKFCVDEERTIAAESDFDEALEALRNNAKLESEIARKVPTDDISRGTEGIAGSIRNTTSSSKPSVGAQGADAQLLAHILAHSPTELPSPAPTLLMLSFSRLLSSRFRDLRQQWEERIAREQSLNDNANEGGAYYTTSQNAQVSRGLMYCTTRDKFIFSSYIELAHRMMFSCHAENLSLLPFWMSTLFHLFTVVVPPPDEETDEEDVERIPGSAIALESIRRENRQRESSSQGMHAPPVKDFSDPEALRRKHIWRYYRHGPNTSPQGGLRAILGEQLADLVVIAHTDTPTLIQNADSNENNTVLSGTPGGMAEREENTRTLQRVLPIEVLSVICMFIGREPTSQATQTSVEGYAVNSTRGCKAQRKRCRIFLGAVGLLALCHRLDQFIAPSSIRDTRVLHYLEELWEAADDAVNGVTV